MELSLILFIIMLVVLGFMFWILRCISRSLKNIRKSLDHLMIEVALLNDQLTILLYLEIKDKPDLLEKSPGLEERALEAAERLGRKQLTSSEEVQSDTSRKRGR